MPKLLSLVTFAGLSACSGPKFIAPPARAAPELGVAGGEAVAIVRVASPWYAPSFMIRSRFAAVVPEYEAIAGLRRKYFTLSEDREFGGIYLWRSRVLAEAYYSESWRARVREKYGVEGDVQIFEVPFIVEGSAKLEGEAIDEHAQKYPAWATWLAFDAAGGGGGSLERVRALAAAHGVPSGLVRSYYLGDGGVIDLWATQQHASEFLTETKLRELGATSRVTGFEAPVLLENP